MRVSVSPSVTHTQHIQRSLVRIQSAVNGPFSMVGKASRFRTQGERNVKLWALCGFHVGSVWVPFNVGSVWVPCGLCVGSTQCGLCVGSVWSLCGYSSVRLGSVWVPCARERSYQRAAYNMIGGDCPAGPRCACIDGLVSVVLCWERSCVNHAA